MSAKGISSTRWSNYFFRRGSEFHSFWKKYLGDDERNLLCVLAQGFDPRTCYGMKALAEAGGSGKRDCIIVEFDEGPNSPSMRHADLVERNKKVLTSVFPSGTKTVKKVSMWSTDSRRIGSRSAANIFSGIQEFSGYTDLIIDISAMPRGIFFPLIGKVLYLVDTSSKASESLKINVHVIVSENAQMDSRIKDEGIDDDASYMHGFTGDLGTVSTKGSPKVWILILGEKQKDQLERIYSLVSPEEICPVLPMPSVNPRRTDNLLVEYRELLFDRLRVDQRNFIYVAEQNPFEVYREIHRAILHYNEALKSLGGCQVIISALSSKLLSIGALLAAYELKDYGLGVGVAHVETQGYAIESGLDIEKELSRTELSELWLAGDCYER